MTIPLGVVNTTINSALFESQETVAQACQTTSQALSYLIQLNEGLVYLVIIMCFGFVLMLAAEKGLFKKILFDGKNDEEKV